MLKKSRGVKAKSRRWNKGRGEREDRVEGRRTQRDDDRRHFYVSCQSKSSPMYLDFLLSLHVKSKYLKIPHD